MTSAQTPSGQRPPNATCKYCGRAITYSKLEGWHDPMAGGDDAIWRGTCDANDTFAADHEPADALDAAPARLTPEQWQEAVERAATKMFDGGFLSEIPPSVLQAETEMDICRIVANLSIRAAFPHLAPNPECGCFYCDRPTSGGAICCAACRAEREAHDHY